MTLSLLRERERERERERASLAFCTGRNHSFLSFFTVYSKTVPRAWRGWMLSFEILTFMFCIAVETNFQYPDPDCAHELSELECEANEQIRIGPELIEAVWSRRKRDQIMRPVCEWETCSKSCQPIAASGDAIRRHFFFFKNDSLSLSLKGVLQRAPRERNT